MLGFGAAGFVFLEQQCSPLEATARKGMSVWYGIPNMLLRKKAQEHFPRAENAFDGKQALMFMTRSYLCASQCLLSSLKHFDGLCCKAETTLANFSLYTFKQPQGVATFWKFLVPVHNRKLKQT